VKNMDALVSGDASAQRAPVLVKRLGERVRRAMMVRRNWIIYEDSSDEEAGEDDWEVVEKPNSGFDPMPSMSLMMQGVKPKRPGSRRSDDT